MNKTERILKKIHPEKLTSDETTKFSRYLPGKPIKNSKGEDIENSTALSEKSSAYFDPNPNVGGHTIDRYGLNDRLEQFKLTHEEAKNLLVHLKKCTSRQKESDVKSNE